MIEFGAARNLRDTVDLCCSVGVIDRRSVLKESPKKRTQVRVSLGMIAKYSQLYNFLE